MTKSPSINVVGAAMGLAYAAGSAAIGAAASNKHPAVGALVGVGVAQALAIGLVAALYPKESKGYVVPALLIGTTVVGGGGAIGASIASRRPALGAAVGAGTAVVIGNLATAAYGPIKLESAQKNGELQGASVGTRYVVREGVFP